MKLVFPCEVECRSYRLCRKRVNIFLTFSRTINPVPDFASRTVPTRKMPAFGPCGEYPMLPAFSFSEEGVLQGAEFGEPRIELSSLRRMRPPPFHGDNAVTISPRRRRVRASRTARIGAISQSLGALRSPLCAIACARDRWNLIESEEGCADASHLQPCVAKHGRSIFLMARAGGVNRLRVATA